MAAGKGPVLRMLLLVLACVTAVLTFGSFFVAWYEIPGDDDDEKSLQVGEVDYLTYIVFTMATTMNIGTTSKPAVISVKFSYDEASMPALGVLYAEVTALLALGFVFQIVEILFNSFSVSKNRFHGKFGAFCKGRVLSILICVFSVLSLAALAGACFLATTAPEARNRDGFNAGCGGKEPPAWCSTYTGVGHGPSIGWIMTLFAWILHLPIVGISIYSSVKLRIIPNTSGKFEPFQDNKEFAFANGGDAGAQMTQMASASANGPAVL